jgi:hypothetical protein
MHSMDLVAGEGDDTASHVRTIIKRHAIWNRLLRAQRVQRFRQGDVWLRGRPSSACCAVAVLCCKTLVRETSERARPAVLCLPQLLGQPRDARRLNAYAGRTRLRWTNTLTHLEISNPFHTFHSLESFLWAQADLLLPTLPPFLHPLALSPPGHSPTTRP